MTEAVPLGQWPGSLSRIALVDNGQSVTAGAATTVVGVVDGGRLAYHRSGNADLPCSPEERADLYVVGISDTLDAIIAPGSFDPRDPTALPFGTAGWWWDQDEQSWVVPPWYVPQTPQTFIFRI